MREHLPTYDTHLIARGKRPRTRTTYAANLGRFFLFLEGRSTSLATPTRLDVEAFLSRPNRDGSPRAVRTRNQELAALRGFATLAKREGWYTADPTEGIAFLKKPRFKPPVPTTGELMRLFLFADTFAEPRRSAALLTLALFSQDALRVHELVALDVWQLDFASGLLLQAVGKGGTCEDFPLNTPTLTLAAGWLAQRARLAPPEESALFVNRRGSRLSIRSVERLLVELREGIGSKKKITPHSLRHGAATEGLLRGADISTVAGLLRHSDINTTRDYTHCLDVRVRALVESLASLVPRDVLRAKSANDNIASGGSGAVAGDLPVHQLDSKRPENNGLVDEGDFVDVGGGTSAPQIDLSRLPQVPRCPTSPPLVA